MVICERLFILRHNFKIDSVFSNGNLIVISAEFKIKLTNVISFVCIRHFSVTADLRICKM